jgi:hypothetical protein
MLVAVCKSLRKCVLEYLEVLPPLQVDCEIDVAHKWGDFSKTSSMSGVKLIFRLQLAGGQSVIDTDVLP